MSNEHRYITLDICLRVIFWAQLFLVQLVLDNKLPSNRFYYQDEWLFRTDLVFLP